MNKPSDISGIGKLDRKRLTAILRGTQHTISVVEAAKILNLSTQHAAKLLSRWAAKGWLSRIKRGLYIKVPLEAKTSDITLEDPWAVAEKIYHPCYVGGWSAAEHWGLTEQIFRTIVIMTRQKPKKRHPTFKGTTYLLRTIPEKMMFGLQSIWKDQIKVFISDPTKTIVDLLVDPKLGGGIRNVVDILHNYLKSEYKNLNLLVDYVLRLNNGAVFKRLGLLLELYAPEEKEIIVLCHSHLTLGKVKLDPQLKSDSLITRWRLWVPKNWKNK